MFRYVVVGISTLFLAACLPTNDCPQCQKPIPKPLDTRKQIKIGASEINMPPYLIATDHTGLEQEIIERSFELAGYKAVFEYTNNRKQQYANKDELHCITTVIEPSGVGDIYGVKSYFSDPIVPYQDVAIYLENPHFKIQTINDLKGKKVEAFKRADKILGFQHLNLDSSSYREHSSKASQILMLYHQTVDVLLMDVLMFDFYYRKMESKLHEIERKKREELANKTPPESFSGYKIKVTPLFSPQPYQIACKDQQLLTHFNAGLKLVKQSNQGNLSEYEQMLKKSDYQLKTPYELVLPN